MGSEVDNAGSITTPKGQTELAAGDAFILRPGYGTKANQYSSTNGNEVVAGACPPAAAAARSAIPA